jgi:hypothetical protein
MLEIQFFQTNVFNRCINDFRKAICSPTPLSPAETAVKTHIANFGSDHARDPIFQANVFNRCINEFGKAIALPHSYLPSKRR